MFDKKSAHSKEIIVTCEYNETHCVPRLQNTINFYEVLDF